MRIEFLGTGGAITTPKPGCGCRVCAQARVEGVPYSRTGPSVFVHGPNVLIDTPEESKYQLNRSSVDRINGCLYSHWHPDHTMGMRVWETRNIDLRNWPPQQQSTTMYFPQQVAVDLRQKTGLWASFEFHAGRGILELVELADGDVLTLEGVRIKPIRLAEEYVYAFLFEDDDRRVLIAPDELLGWDPPDSLSGLDLAVLPMGVAEFNPLTGERHIHAEHSVLKSEATFRQTLDMIVKLSPSRILLTHIEEPDALTHDDLLVVADQVSEQRGLGISFAYDALSVEV